MKLPKPALFLTLAFFAGAAAYGVVIVHRGFSARGTPSIVETFAARTALALAVPSSYHKLHNPLPPSPENIEAGMKHFADHCAACHDNNGSGDTMFGRGLYPKPPDMRRSETQNKSDGELYYIIENGIRLSGMPAFAEHSRTDETETWNLVSFIRHLPALTDAELTEMGNLNPKTEEDRKEEQIEQDFLDGSYETKPSNHKH
jgi:mono/diheme cytochrome c family protein